MDIIERLPWHYKYMILTEGLKNIEKEIEALENPEKELQRVKKFYNNIGADYTKNRWICQVEEDITQLTKGSNSRLSQLKEEKRIGTVLEAAVTKQDNDSIAAINAYKDSETYKELVGQVMFYIGVSKVKKEPDYIRKAYDAIYKTYPMEKLSLFEEEGVYYYIYYFQCLQECVKRHQDSSDYYKIKEEAHMRCYNAKLMFNKYRNDCEELYMYVVGGVKLITDEIEKTEAVLEEK